MPAFASASAHWVTEETFANRPGGSFVVTDSSVCSPSERAMFTAKVGCAPATLLDSSPLPAGLKGVVAGQASPEPLFVRVKDEL